MSSMANVLTTSKRAAIVSALIEGCSVRATARMIGVSKDTVLKLQRELGEACIRFMDENLRGLACRKLQADEVWSFVYAKDKNLPEGAEGGSVWTFTAIDAETKLIPSFRVGSRDTGTATEFAQDLASRLEGRVQLTTDGGSWYLSAVPDAFGFDVDYAQLIKVYGPAPDGPEHRYSPPECIDCRSEVILGDPDPKHVSTSYVERHNLTIRMSLRRFTRLTNAHSKKIEHHVAALGLFFCFYNYCRPHSSLKTAKNNRVTPCMAAGVTDRAWTVEELVNLLPAPVATKRGPYKRRNSN